MTRIGRRQRTCLIGARATWSWWGAVIIYCLLSAHMLDVLHSIVWVPEVEVVQDGHVIVDTQAVTITSTIVPDEHYTDMMVWQWEAHPLATHVVTTTTQVLFVLKAYLDDTLLFRWFAEVTGERHAGPYDVFSTIAVLRMHGDLEGDAESRYTRQFPRQWSGVCVSINSHALMRKLATLSE